MHLATSLDKEVFDQQNQLRSDPASYIGPLMERIPMFNSQTYVPSDGQPSSETIEGSAAVEDAISDLRLRSGSMLNNLEWSPGLALAARDHCADAGKLGLVGPLGSKGQTPATRVALYGDAGSALGENLAYGGTQSGFEIVMQLLIDDGVTSRTSRRLLFDPRWNYTGIATCAHSTRTMMTSIVYSAKDFRPNEYGLAKLAENPKSKVMPSAPQIPMVGGMDREVVGKIFELQNEIRVNPGNFLADLKALPATAAVMEACEAVENWNQNLSPLAWNNGLFLASRDHCNDLGPKQLIGPFGTNKSSPYERISKYGHTNFWRAENRALTSDSFGSDAGAIARQIVLNMFVDETFGGRPHRQNLVNPNLNQVGIFTCGHGDQRFTVLDYAGKIELKASAQDEINVLLRKHHPAIQVEEQEEQSCSSLPKTIVTNAECAIFDEINNLRKQPSDFAIMLHNMLRRFGSGGRRLQVLSRQQNARLNGPALNDMSTTTKYRLLRALNVIKRVRGAQSPLQFSDVLFLAAREHAAEVCTQGITGSVGADGKTLPTDRVGRWGRVAGLEDYVILGAANDLHAVMDLILKGNTKNLLNGYLTKAAIATCPISETSAAVVIYLAENVMGNSNAAMELARMKQVRTPLNAEAELRIVQLKQELLGLVAQERSARLVRDVIKERAMGDAIAMTVAKIKAQERRLVQAKISVDEGKRAAKLKLQEIAVLEGKIRVAMGDLAIAVAKKQRLSRAKNILMMRSGVGMNNAEELDFKRSIDSFVELVDRCVAEVVAAQAVVDALVAKRNELIGVKAEPEVIVAPAPAPVVRDPTPAPAPVIADPEFDKLLPDTLQELPSGAPAAETPGLFDNMVPTGLAPPSAESASGASSDPFADLLPDGLRVLENEGAAAAMPNASTGFPVPEGLGDLIEEDVDENDVTEDILEDQDDFDFNEITAGVPGADELLNGGRRLEGEDFSDVSNLLFGSANLAL